MLGDQNLFNIMQKCLVCQDETTLDYDFVVYIDADVLININSPPIHDYYDFGDKIGAVDEWSQPSFDKKVFVHEYYELPYRYPHEYLRREGFSEVGDLAKKVLNSGVLVFQPRKHRAHMNTYYELALKNNLKLIDASCPVVLKLQNQIKNGYKEIKEIDGQVVIYGKKGHAEVTGLIGQTNGNAIIVESLNDIDKIDFSKPISIYSQTTKSPKSYSEIIDEIKNRSNSKLKFIVKDTLCRQVSGREPQLQKFSNENQVIIFVSGKKSSNGKMLYDSCKKVNPNSYFISDTTEIKSSWFKQKVSVGICGATSTPLWLMQKVAQKIADLSL